jgi:carbon monoxide dehydrogenase subunit G
MATIRREFRIEALPDRVWDAVRDIGALHTRLVPGFVVDTRLEEGARVVTFANGFVARELIVDVDDEHRRIAWSVVGSPRMTHHNASLEVLDDGDATRAIWIADLLPHEAAPEVAAMIEHAIAAMQRAFVQEHRG